MVESGPPAVDETLGAMAPEDLVRVGGLLEALLEDEAFQFVVRLVGVDVAKREYQLTARPLGNVQEYAHVAGEIRGRRAALAVVGQVIQKAQRVREALEREAREEQ